MAHKKPAPARLPKYGKIRHFGLPLNLGRVKECKTPAPAIVF
jgi:hypothetical protein